MYAIRSYYVPSRQAGGERRNTARAQQADQRHHLAFGRPGPGPALEPQPDRSHKVQHRALRRAGG